MINKTEEDRKIALSVVLGVILAGLILGLIGILVL
jgi:hypothetical protein